MFVVEEILVSDQVADAPFACNLGACLGGCCVQGDSGAPLEEEEVEVIEQILPRVRKYLRPEALKVIDTQGSWERTRDGGYATSCVDDAECVFVTYEGNVAKCGIEKAYREGRVDFQKPISCHLYPIRIERYGDVETLNYEQIPLCDSGRAHGCRLDLQLADFLREPLIRKYGETWYEAFRQTCEERRKILRENAPV